MPFIIYPASQQNPDLDNELPNKMFNVLLSFADRWSDADISMPEEIYNARQHETKRGFLPQIALN